MGELGRLFMPWGTSEELLSERGSVNEAERSPVGRSDGRGVEDRDRGESSRMRKYEGRYCMCNRVGSKETLY